ncbi:PSME3-interacting protein-like [Guaruba guarouba]
MDGADGTADLVINKRFVSESELEERRKRRQEEWEKVRKPDDPEVCPEEAYNPHSLYEVLQEQREKKQEFDEQFKFKNMVRGLDEDETHFLDEVSQQQELLENEQREEELKELNEYRISFMLKWLVVDEKLLQSDLFAFLRPLGKGSMLKKNLLICCLDVFTGRAGISTERTPDPKGEVSAVLAEDVHSTLAKVGISVDPKKETEKKLPMKSVENKNKFSQAKLLAGAVKHRLVSHLYKFMRNRTQLAVLNGYLMRNKTLSYFVHSSDGGNSVKRLKLDTDHDEKNQEKTSCVPLGSSSVGGSTVHCSSAAVCIGILPGLGAYSGSSDSESSSDSEGTINSTGRIVSSVFRSNNFFDGP